MNNKLSNQKNIEIEFRAIFGENDFYRLKEYLDLSAENIWEDDKDVFFCIMPDKLLKVVDNISKNNAKIVLKLNKIGKGSDFEEIEIPIGREQINDFVKILNALGFTDNIMHSFQKRQNYVYKGVEVALKHSEVWGYHLELEIMITDIKEKEQAEKKIREVANDLNIKLMTDQELAEFTKKAEEKNKTKSNCIW